jgi:hypothetical protein
MAFPFGKIFTRPHPLVRYFIDIQGKEANKVPYLEVDLTAVQDKRLASPLPKLVVCLYR